MNKLDDFDRNHIDVFPNLVQVRMTDGHQMRFSHHMEIDKVRVIASYVDDLKEVFSNETSAVISFHKLSFDCIIDVKYSSRIVITSLTHPKSGKTQLVRDNVTYVCLIKIFNNPRVHTGNGFHQPIRKKKAINTINICYQNEEKDKLYKQMRWLQVQVEDVSAHCRILESQLHTVAATLQMNNQTEAVANITSEQMCSSPEVGVNDEVNWCAWSLKFANHFPASMVDVACVAIANSGYIAVLKDGSCRFDSIPVTAYEALQQQHFSGIQYVALGSNGQYFILRQDGMWFFHGPKCLEEAVMHSNSRVKYVAFGSDATYCVQFENGAINGSCDLPEEMLISLRLGGVNNVWLGDSSVLHAGSAATIPYAVLYDSGKFTCNYLPPEVESWFQEHWTSANRLHQLLASNGCFFICYS